MTATISGLVSGFDSASLIDAIIASKTVPIQALQTKKSGYETKISKLGSLNSALAAFETVLEGLAEDDDILSVSAESSDESVLTTSGDSDAQQGIYDITVTALALAEKNQSSEFSDSTDEVKAGTLGISVNGAADVNVTINSGDTLEDVKNAINSADAGVSAALIYNGVDGYTLQLTADDTGFETASASDAIVLTESYTGGTGQELTFTESQTAVNAALTVDGVAATSTSNTVTDVLEGVTLELLDTGTVEVTVGTDTEGTIENITAFVDAYNAVLTLVQDEYETSELSDKAKDLSGDSLLQKIKSDLQLLAGGEISGLSGDYTALSIIGITTGADGLLDIDSSKLEEALDDDMDAVAAMFTTDDTGLVDLFLDKIDNYTDPFDGLIALRDKSYDQQILRIDDRIETLEDRLTQLNDRLILQFTAMENAIAGFQQQGGALTGLFAL